jgi:flagellar biosynthesis chaperone FliJ
MNDKVDKIIKKLESLMDEYKEYVNEDWNDGLIHQGWFECSEFLIDYIKEMPDE